MAPQRAGNKANAPSSSVRGAKVQKQRKRHKVVLESAGNKDEDKLRVVLSFHANPPPGFTFIPAGNTQLTAAMKAFAKKGGHQVMAVSATPHAARHELSREVHRIGYHFPTEVVDQVCSHYGIRLDDSGRLIGEQDNDKLFMKISQKGEVVLNENIRDQVTINTEAKEIIRDLFPKIPDNDLFQIIKTAFQLGDKKVGTAEEIPLVRRAQLSVVAHIRHSYTNYDKLLRQVPYNEARHMVEKTTLRKLVEWRGDENDQTEESRKAVDDAVREVVVLSDEEDSESELEEGQVLEKDDMKVEPVHRPPRPELTTQHRPVSPGDQSSGEDAPAGYRYVPQTSRRNPFANATTESTSRQQESRYALWDQVRQEYRNGLPTQDAPHVIARIPLDEPPLSRHEEVAYEPMPSVRYVVADPQPVRQIPQPSPQVFRGPDGRLYERLPPQGDTPVSARRIYTPPTRNSWSHNQSRRSASPRAHRPQYHRRTPSMNDDGSVMPSIEPPDNAFESPSLRQSHFDRHRNLIDLTSSAEKATERMRLSQSPPPSPYYRAPNTGIRDVEMLDPDEPLRHRRMIDLDNQPPTPLSSSRSDVAAHTAMRSRHQHGQPMGVYRTDERAFPRTEHIALHHPLQGATRTYLAHEPAAPRHVVYESIDDRETLHRPVRYVAEQSVPTYRDDPGRRYYVLDRHIQDQQPVHPYQPDAPRRQIVLEPDGQSRYNIPSDPRYQPTYRTTFVQH